MGLADGPGRHESVPTYEESPRDPRANAYKLTQHRDTFELSCDVTGEHFTFCAPPLNLSDDEPDVKTKKAPGAASIDISQSSATDPSLTHFAQFSGITRKKFNIRRREPVVTLTSRHGEVPLTLFRGNYCGFTHPDEEVEFFWQLRSHETARMSADRPRMVFRDAVLRRTAKEQKSTMTGMYLPNDKVTTPGAGQQQEDGAMGAHGSNEDADEEESPQYDIPHGRLLIRSDLSEFDKDLAIVSFIAVFVRVIEAEKRTPFVNGFIRAMTVGEG